MRGLAWRATVLAALVCGAGCAEVSPPSVAAGQSRPVAEPASPKWDILSLASYGGPGSELGQFREPSGIAVGPRGELYVADTGNHRVQVLGPSGSATAALGSFGWDVGEFDSPQALALSAVGRSTLYVADRGSRRVQGCDLLGMFFRSVAEDTADRRLDPTGLAVGRRNEVYIADAAGHRVWRLSVEGNVDWMRGSFGPATDELNAPAGIALDDSGGMLVSDAGNRRLVRMDFAGNAGAVWRPDGLATPGAVAWSDGRWFVCDTEAGGVVVVDSGGITETIIGSADVAAPGGVAVGSVLYVTDRAAHDIKRYRIERRAPE